MFRCGVVYNLEVPKAISDYLADLGGYNLYNEPLFRVVWSNNTTKSTRLPWPSPIPGAIIERPHRLKYGRATIRDRFILEKWQPPELYGDADDWVDQEWKSEFGLIDYGPYPSRGQYNLVDIIEGIDKSGTPCFLMPTRDYLRTAVEATTYIRSISAAEHRRMVEIAEQKEESARDERRLDMIRDANKPSNYHDIWMSLNTNKKPTMTTEQLFGRD